MTHKPSLLTSNILFNLHFSSFLRFCTFLFSYVFQTDTISLASLVSSSQGTYYNMLCTFMYECAMYLERNKHFDWSNIDQTWTAHRSLCDVSYRWRRASRTLTNDIKFGVAQVYCIIIGIGLQNDVILYIKLNTFVILWRNSCYNRF